VTHRNRNSIKTPIKMLDYNIYTKEIRTKKVQLNMKVTFAVDVILQGLLLIQKKKRTDVYHSKI
jgi:hypothetical protein